MTASLLSGETTKLPPASATASTSVSLSTVPAPIEALPGKAVAAARIELNGPGRVERHLDHRDAGPRQRLADGDRLGRA